MFIHHLQYFSLLGRHVLSTFYAYKVENKYNQDPSGDNWQGGVHETIREQCDPVHVHMPSSVLALYHREYFWQWVCIHPYRMWSLLGNLWQLGALLSTLHYPVSSHLPNLPVVHFPNVCFYQLPKTAFLLLCHVWGSAYGISYWCEGCLSFCGGSKIACKVHNNYYADSGKQVNTVYPN